MQRIPTSRSRIFFCKLLMVDWSSSTWVCSWEISWLRLPTKAIEETQDWVKTPEFSASINIRSHDHNHEAANSKLDSSYNATPLSLSFSLLYLVFKISLRNTQAITVVQSILQQKTAKDLADKLTTNTSRCESTVYWRHGLVNNDVQAEEMYTI